MDLNLRGKTAVITGASKGIGFAVANALAEEGCDLHIVSRSSEGIEKAATHIQSKYAVKVTAHALDLSQSESATALFERVKKIDILVNNAGAIPGGDLEKVDEQTWRSAWDLKVFGYINLCRLFYGAMKAQAHGVIVNVTGLAADRLDTNYIAGSSANASLNAFSRALGSNSFKDGIRVLAVSPGAVETERMVGLMKTKSETQFGDASRWRELLKGLPYERAATVEEVANVVLFLASPKASYLSGIVVNVDGGQNARGGAF